MVAALSARGGVIRAFAPSTGVPVYKKFFLGGGDSVRGYAERHLGPMDAQGNPTGGNVMTGANAELRFPIFRQLGGAVFLDGGQTSPDWSRAQPAAWRYGAGSGIRLKTPVGPLRLDLGYKLNPAPGDRSLWRLHLSLGEAI